VSTSPAGMSIHLEAEVLYQSLLRHLRGWLVQVGTPGATGRYRLGRCVAGPAPES
jgi:hypothetical protein